MDQDYPDIHIRYLASPEDEDAIRIEMREKCAGRFPSTKMNDFFDEEVDPALRSFEALIRREYEDFAFELDDAGFRYHENALGTDIYSMRSAGVRVALEDRLFYYYVYAMSPPGTPHGAYCIFIKSNGTYRFFFKGIEECSKHALFEDVKRFFLKADLHKASKK
jgi:hypothetical protein